jgi:hypothetical protein
MGVAGAKLPAAEESNGLLPMYKDGPLERVLDDSSQEIFMAIDRSVRFFRGTAVIVSVLFPMISVAENYSQVIQHFVGSWKENEARRKIGSGVGLRFRRAASGGIEELRGPENRPLVQPVKFGTKPYDFDNSGNSIEWKQIDNNHFERQIFENGKLLATRRIAISADGKQLTEVTQRATGGMERTTTMVFSRTSGDQQGLVGAWKPESVRNSEPAEQKVEAVGNNGLRVTGFNGFT